MAPVRSPDQQVMTSVQGMLLCDQGRLLPYKCWSVHLDRLISSLVNQNRASAQHVYSSKLVHSSMDVVWLSHLCLEMGNRGNSMIHWVQCKLLLGRGDDSNPWEPSHMSKQQWSSQSTQPCTILTHTEQTMKRNMKQCCHSNRQQPS